MNQRGRYRWMRRQTPKRCCDRRRRLRHFWMRRLRLRLRMMIRYMKWWRSRLRVL